MINLIRVNTIFKVFKKISICFIFILNTAISSQNQPVNSTESTITSTTEITEAILLKTANDFITNKEYNKAATFLSKHYNNFKESLNVNWLYAHVLYLNGDKKQAENKFKKAISIASNNKDLQLDYARFLYETGKTNKSEAILSKYITDDSKEVEFILMQANISFWKGDIKNAQQKINQIQEIYPNTEITNSLSDQIELLTAYYIKSNFEYQTDSQPLKYFAHHIAIGNYTSRYLSPKIEFSTYNFSPQKELAFIVKASNQFYFDKLKLTTNITGGVYKNFSGDADWIGGINFTKKITKNASLNIGFTKSSLLGTIASTSFNLTKQDLFGEVDYANKWILLHASYNHQFFKDDNVIKSIGSWIVSQPLKVNKFNFQIGYGYSYSDAKDNLFVFNVDKTGVYDPYFTPKEQEIHAALFLASYKPTANLSLEAKINYGFIGTVKNPYPNQFDTEIGGFYDDTFTPVEYIGAINYNFSNNFKVIATYTYQETFFYNRNNINLGLNYTF